MLRDERIADYLAGNMAAEQRSDFERDIVKDPEGLAELVGQKCLDAGLHALMNADAERIESAIMATVRSASEEAATERILAETVGAKQKPRCGFGGVLNRLVPQPLFLRIAMACLVCVIGLGAWLVIRSVTQGDERTIANTEQPLNGFAKVTSGASVVWEGDDVGVGSSLAASKLRLKSGIVGIQFTNGASVVLQGPAEMELISPLKSSLAFGKLTARVPETAHGFSVDAGGNQITDRGTAFGINKSAVGPTEVHVFTGKVDVTPRNAAL